MGLVDLSYGPFGHPSYGPSDYLPNNRATAGTRSCRGLLIRALGQHTQLDGPYRRLSAV